MASGILVFSEHDGGKIKKTAFELIAKAVSLNMGPVSAVVVGNAVAIDGDWLLIGGWLDENASPLTDVGAAFTDVDGHCDSWTELKRYCNQVGCGGSGYNNNIAGICESGDADCPGHSKARCMEECAAQQCGAIYWDADHGCGLYDKCLPTGSGNLGTAFSVRDAYQLVAGASFEA